MAEAKTYLDVNSLCKNIGDLTIVDNASFSVLERQKVGLESATEKKEPKIKAKAEPKIEPTIVDIKVEKVEPVIEKQKSLPPMTTEPASPLKVDAEPKPEPKPEVKEEPEPKAEVKEEPAQETQEKVETVEEK